MNKTYATGQFPEVGDIVVVYNKTLFGSGYYSSNNWKNGAKYRVKKTFEGAKSQLLLVEPLSENDHQPQNPVSAKNFNLVERASQTKSDARTPEAFLILDETSKVVGKVRTEGEMTTVLQKLLLTNPLGRYQIYNYVSTARTDTPKVILEYGAAKVSEETAPMKSDVLTSGSFRKVR